MKQLKQELDGFANMGTHTGIAGFLQTVQNMNEYEKTQNFVYSVDALKNKKADLDTKFPDVTYYHNQAETLKENAFVIRCTIIQTSLDNVDKDLCEAHALFLERKTDLFIASDFSGLSDESKVNEKFESILREFTEFLNKYTFYPSALKRRKADPSVKKLEVKKQEIINSLKTDNK
jgi:hypothetical protein